MIVNRAAGATSPAEAYEDPNDSARADREETVAAIRAGLADVEAKRTKPARAALRALAKKYGIRTTDA